MTSAAEKRRARPVPDANDDVRLLDQHAPGERHALGAMRGEILCLGNVGRGINLGEVKCGNPGIAFGEFKQRRALTQLADHHRASLRLGIGRFASGQ